MDVGAAKVAKYATSESGDTLEFVERPMGGLSVVLADGQRSGRNAKLISNIVVRKALSLLAEGVRDGAAARAAHDYLRTHRSGSVSAELVIVSADLNTQTLVISRNTHCPALVLYGNQVDIINEPSIPVGVYPDTKPVIREIPLKAGLCVAAFSDGMCVAGERSGGALDLAAILPEYAARTNSAQELADILLAAAIDADHGRPTDDTSVMVITVRESLQDIDIRRMSVTFPI